MSDFGSISGEVLKNYGSVPQSPGDVQNVPHNQVMDHYQQFVQQAPPQQVYQAHQEAFQQLPQNERQSVFGQLLGALTQHGVSPQQVGVQGSAPTPSNLAQIAQYISQNPGLLQSILGQNGALNSPIAKLILSGALAVAANQFSNRGGSKGANKDMGNERIV